MGMAEISPQEGGNQRAKGATAEDLAEEYIKTKGYSIIKRNFHFGREGEIDIIAQDGNTLVFVEVKARYSSAFGTPEEAVTYKKQKTLRRTAEGYLYVNKITNQECRFDVIAVDYEKKPTEIRHIVNAF
jgi:putative endonuclease